MGGWGTTDCLRFFTRVEELEEDERYLCAKCGVRQRSTKKFSIRHNPTVRRVSLAPNPSPSLNCARLQVLCLQLKRFRWGTYTRSKVRDAVAFPVHALDLAPFVDPRSPYVQRPPLYDLCAVVIHHGGGYVCVCVCLCLCVCVCGWPTMAGGGRLGSGHYTTLAYHETLGQWLDYNDSSVSVASEDEVKSAQAYLLFYRLRSSSTRWALYT
jgi:ubiquitin C-terminal hydrolase